MRWKTEDEDAQGALFDTDVDRHVGRGEFRGMEFLHVRAKRIINTLPRSGRLPFTHTINAYRGCSHACSYCMSGDTPILMADGRTRPMADLRIGDAIVGTEIVGRYRRYTTTTVLDHWSTVKPAYRVRLDDGTSVVASGDHRFLSERGWKHVVGDQRPHLTTNNRLLGPARFEVSPDHDREYRLGYLCGMVRGDAIGRTLVHLEPLARTRAFLASLDVPAQALDFVLAVGERTAQSRANVLTIEQLIAWPSEPSLQWTKGFLAGMFDAAGGCSAGVLRVANRDEELIQRTASAIERLGLSCTVERSPDRPMSYVRLLGGLPEQLRFFLLVDPATTRKRTIQGRAVKNSPLRRVTAIEPLGLELPLYDITTGTGDFIANGVISHNCFARPTHDYLGLDIDEGFERQIVVKVNAVERLRAELDPRRWSGEAIAMGTNTDPYQRCEGKYHLTHGVIEVLSAARNPFSILTKSTLILRDAELLAEASRRTDVHVSFSIGTLDRDVWKATEPGTPAPERRVEAIARLREAGVSCGVLVAPVLPGLSDGADQIDAVVAACAEAGAANISGGMVVYLKPGVREVFLGHLARTNPELVARYEAMYTGVRAPRAVQDRVARLTREAVARHHRPAAAGTAVRVHRNAPAASAAAPAPPVQQLELGL